MEHEHRKGLSWGLSIGNMIENYEPSKVNPTNTPELSDIFTWSTSPFLKPIELNQFAKVDKDNYAKVHKKEEDDGKFKGTEKQMEGRIQGQKEANREARVRQRWIERQLPRGPQQNAGLRF